MNTQTQPKQVNNLQGSIQPSIFGVDYNTNANGRSKQQSLFENLKVSFDSASNNNINESKQNNQMQSGIISQSSLGSQKGLFSSVSNNNINVNQSITNEKSGSNLQSSLQDKQGQIGSTNNNNISIGLSNNQNTGTQFFNSNNNYEAKENKINKISSLDIYSPSYSYGLSYIDQASQIQYELKPSLNPKVIFEQKGIVQYQNECISNGQDFCIQEIALIQRRIKAGQKNVNRIKIPQGFSCFPSVEDMELFTEQQMREVEYFVIENQFVKIVFQVPINLLQMNLSNLIFQESYISIKHVPNYDRLNKPCIILFKKFGLQLLNDSKSKKEVQNTVDQIVKNRQLDLVIPYDFEKTNLIYSQDKFII